MNKNILILGAAGMAGHTIADYLKSTKKYNIFTTARNDKLISPDFIWNIEEQPSYIQYLLEETKPAIVINCIGLLVKDSKENFSGAIYINSFFPHYLEQVTKDMNIKCIFISTDCIFCGDTDDKGYTELSTPDAKDNYGRSKALGEIINKKDLTIRTSIIGKELKENSTGLFEWFMKQKGEVKGYSDVYWSGITTLELAKQIDKIINLDLTGLYHLSSDVSISKYNLLRMLQMVWLKTDVNIIADSTASKNKTLINNRKKDYNPNIPCYMEQLKEYRYFINYQNKKDNEVE